MGVSIYAFCDLSIQYCEMSSCKLHMNAKGEMIQSASTFVSALIATELLRTLCFMLPLREISYFSLVKS